MQKKVKEVKDLMEKTTIVGKVTSTLSNISKRLSKQTNEFQPTDEEIEELIADNEKDMINKMLTKDFQKIERINIPDNA